MGRPKGSKNKATGVAKSKVHSTYKMIELRDDDFGVSVKCVLDADGFKFFDVPDKENLQAMKSLAAEYFSTLPSWEKQ